MVKRQLKPLKRIFTVFCEGITECNYFRGFNDASISLRIVNMEGGGYNNFIERIKQEGNFNRLATFIVVDGDRAANDKNERQNLKNLVDYCKRHNNRLKSPPYILIVNCPDYFPGITKTSSKDFDTERSL